MERTGGSRGEESRKLRGRGPGRSMISFTGRSVEGILQKLDENQISCISKLYFSLGKQAVDLVYT